ncbi:MAG: xanthine dehydrogenase family protein subunit M [Gemmatimonadetes bacterium]|nr:xanthine dehydrogenase family protein subunit M [Gemmatimonadota bacterium]NNM06789.1 xanthine dehydrogenase family protein subunit M [Gemmatimonadota bacterium]
MGPALRVPGLRLEGKDAVGRSVEYHRPSSLAEACELLHQLGDAAIPLAGGTDVVVDLRRGTKAPKHLVSLADLSALRGISLSDGALTVGALVTPTQLETSQEVASTRPEFLDAVGVFGTPQVRNRATVGGNLCTAASCADLSPLLLVLNARVTVATPTGSREVPLEEFFGDHRSTVLEPGHLVSAVSVPSRAPGEGAAYEAFGLRAANSITVAGAAAYLRMEEGLCTGARVALGAVSPCPLLVPGVEEVLVGTEAGDPNLERAALAAADAAEPLSDIRGTAAHRRELVERLTVRAFQVARGRAQ